MRLRQWIVKIGVPILWVHQLSFNDLAQKSFTGYPQLEESTANTPIDVFFNLVWSHHWLKMTYFCSYFMFIKVRNYLATNFTAEDFRIQIRGPPDNYVHGCHVTPVTRGALGYVSNQKGIIQGHPGHRYATREALGLCSRIVFWAVFTLDVSTHTVLLYYMSVKHTFMSYFVCF